MSSFSEDIRDAFRTCVTQGDEIESLRTMLKTCVDALEAVYLETGIMHERGELDEALCNLGLIRWDTVPKSGEIDASFDGAEDLEPGDDYWTTTRKWGEIVAAAKRQANP